MDYYSYFKRKYPYINDEDLEILEFQAKEILIHLLFKSSKRATREQREYAYDEYAMWILRCMQEIVERQGMTSALSYSENGISITFSREQISKALLDEIVPFVGVK